MSQDAAPTAERPTKPAIWNGLRRCCPNCGEGKIFDGYLKVVDNCPVCNEDLSHSRADDGPAYLTILVVGHVLAILMHLGFSQFRPDPLLFASVLTVICVGLSLFLLPRFKGMIIGIQWARRMHGFGGTT
ncbi:DUF983 domain-containing protein [Octadecabacter sp. CECT 8868]|uniref:DUF983 domain-containing protein n=1 Tax=Octadecabacter algicola TaxID=2909342 RepID=UPI001F4440F9|nr:DUF983 domain-containing protein [Octadecabacter algicola]MCF2904591.1 DUF983 domain-containing protein [Octadecabacter algicola]